MAMTVRLPGKHSLERCMEIITTEDAANFFEQRLSEQLTKAKVADQFGPLLKDVHAFRDSFGGDDANSVAWTGREPTRQTSFQAYQDAIAKQSASLFSDKNIRFDYAVSDDAEIIRAYSENGEAVDDEMAAELDKLFNAWLAEKGMLTKDGVIYEASADGKIKQENNKNKKADVERVRDLIKDSKTGFKEFLSKKNDSLTIEPVTHEHPNDQAKKAQETRPS